MREPMITRTIKSTKAKVMVLDVTNGTTSTQEFVLPRTYKTDNDVLKALADKNTGTTKLVHVVSTEVCTELYGMPEAKFVELAQVINKEGKENA